MPHRYPPEYWRRQAHETRQLVAMVSLANDKLALIKMSEDYDRLARDAVRLGEQEEQALIDNRLRLHRAAVVVLMRVAGERRIAIKESRALIERSLEALDLAEVLLSRTPSYAKAQSPRWTSFTFAV